MSEQACPRCNGEGKVRGLACPGARWIEMGCVQCDGSGRITEQQAAWIELGKIAATYRRDVLRLSLREVAKALVCDAVKLSHAERGREDPTRLATLYRSLAQ